MFCKFKRAQELNARFTVRLERTADGSLQARVRNLRSREEKLVSPGAVLDALV